jgi:hypothetical protein
MGNWPPSGPELPQAPAPRSRPSSTISTMRAWLVAVLVGLALAGCGDDGDEQVAPTTIGLQPIAPPIVAAPSDVRPVVGDPVFAAEVPGTQAFIGLAVRDGGRHIVAYACDGAREGPAEALTVNSWWVGDVNDGQVDVVNDIGERLQGRVDGTTFVGAISVFVGRANTLTTLNVSAPAVTGNAGLSWGAVPGGSWRGLVRLQDGREKGTSYPPYVRCRPTGCEGLSSS